MNERNKQVLKIWLIAFAVITVFKIINTIDDSFLKGLFELGFAPLEIASLVLFVYVSNRGEEKIAQYGIITILVYFALYAFKTWSIYDLNLSSSAEFIDRFLSSLYFFSGNCVVIFEFLAIFSFLKSNDDKVEKLELAALIGVAVYTLLAFIINLFAIDSEFLLCTRNIIGYIGTLAKYAAIILCLTDNNFVSNVFVPCQDGKNYYLNKLLHKTKNLMKNNGNMYNQQQGFNNQYNMNMLHQQQNFNNQNNMNMNNMDMNNMNNNMGMNNMNMNNNMGMNNMNMNSMGMDMNNMNMNNMNMQNQQSGFDNQNNMNMYNQYQGQDDKFVMDSPNFPENDFGPNTQEDDSYINPFSMNQPKKENKEKNPMDFGKPF